MKQSRCLLALTMCLLLTNAVPSYTATQQYTVTDLGEFSPSDVNEAGQVIGQAAGGPAMWKDGVMMPMQHLGSGGKPVRWSEAGQGISVGYVINPSSPVGALVAAQWDASGAMTLLYTRDQLHGSLANAQNANGVTSGFGGRMDNIYGAPVSSAFRWDSPYSLTILDTQDGLWSESAGIDGEGNVWGWDGTNPVYWNAGGVKSVLPGKSGLSTYPVVVSNSGRAMGVSAVRDPNQNIVGVPMQATIAQGFSAMQMLTNADSCEPVDVNNAGISVGNCWMTIGGPPVPVLWEGGAIRRLLLEVPEDVRNLTLRGLNDRGVLVASGSVLEDRPYGYPISRSRGFLFSPVREPAALALSQNQTSFRPGDTLRMDLAMQNPGPILTTDVYVGIILPDGVDTLFLTNLSPLEGSMTTLDSDPRTFARFLRNASWPAGLHATQQDYFTYTFTGLEPVGTYHFLVGWTTPNSLEDGRIDDGDVVALAWAPFTLTRGSTEALYATKQAKRARHMSQGSPALEGTE